jgi:hypothetical protein
VAGGAVQAHAQQDLFGGGRVGHQGVAQLRGASGDLTGQPGQRRGARAGDPGDGPHLRIRQPPGRERRTDLRQVLEGVRHPEVFGGGAQIHPGPPGQPVRTGADAVPGPPVPVVELG